MQADAANNASNLSNAQYNQTRADQAPFRQGGLTAQNRLMTFLGIGGTDPSAATGTTSNDGTGFNVNATSPEYGKYGRDFSMSDFQADPGYAFRLSEGNKALNANAAARGGLISGNALKAATAYGQDMGSQEYTNAFNRYQTNRTNQIAPLQSLMGAGQSATNFVGNAGATNAANVGNYMTGGAAAGAAGLVGSANAVNSGLSSYLGYTSNNNLINALNARNAGGGGVGAGYPGYDTFSNNPIG